MRGRTYAVALFAALVVVVPVGRATTPNIVIFHSLARVAADGTGLAGVGPPTMQSWDAVASTDGKQFAFLEADGVGIANADFTDVNRLSTDPATQLAWSGDGTRLALCSCGPLDSPRVAVADVRSGVETVLPFAAGSPSLSPTGDRLAVFLPDTGRSAIVTPAGRILRRLGAVQDVRFAPRGHLLAYVDPEKSLVCVMRDDGTGRRCLAAGAGPVWAPDGRRLAFQTTRNAGFTSRIAVAAAVGRPATRLVSASIPTPYNRFETLDSAIRPAWSLDGRRLVYATTDGLHVLDLRAHDRRIQVPDAPFVRYPVFTRDGHIVFTSTGFGWDAPH